MGKTDGGDKPKLTKVGMETVVCAACGRKLASKDARCPTLVGGTLRIICAECSRK